MTPGFTETIEQRQARKAAWRMRPKKKAVIVTPVHRSKHSDRVSTFPARFEGLRDRLFAEAKVTPAFLDTVFTLRGTPTDNDIMQTIEHRLFDLIHTNPDWFANTPDADTKAHELRREYNIAHGLIQAAPLTPAQQAAIARRKQERIDRDARIEARASSIQQQQEEIA